MIYYNIKTDLCLSLFRYVEGADLLICGNYIFNQYQDCKDLHYFLCADKINDVLCLPSNRIQKIVPICACQDRVLRVLDVSF